MTFVRHTDQLRIRTRLELLNVCTKSQDWSKLAPCLHFCFSATGKERPEKSNLAVAYRIYTVYSLLTIDISRLLLAPLFELLTQSDDGAF